MSWPCFLIKSIRLSDWEETPGGGRTRYLSFTLPDGREVKFEDLPPGAMWHSSLNPDPHGEPSLCVVLPGKVIWHMNRKGTDGCTWQITGEPPNVNATPSINYVGVYHGWVQNGSVTDDVEGRKFDLLGKPIS